MPWLVAITLVAVNAANRNPRELFEIGDDGTKGVAVVRIGARSPCVHDAFLAGRPSPRY